MILAVAQGVLEWIPVSSEGQIFLLALTMGVPPQEALSLAFYMHLGTGIAAIAYYRREFLESLRGGPLMNFLIVGSLVTGLIGLPIMKMLMSVLEGSELVISLAVGIFLIVLGFLLRSLEERGDLNRVTPNLRDSIITGAAQGLAVIPGVSRSAATISVLLLRGFDLESAFKLSFMLGGIATLAAGLMQMESVNQEVGAISIIATLVVGYVALYSLNKLGKRIRMSTFALSFGALSLVLSIIRILLLQAW